MSTLPSPCGRCIVPTTAVITEMLTFGGTTYVIPLCGAHATNMRRSILSWCNAGTVADDEPLRSEGESSPDRGTVVASYIAVPLSRPHPPTRPQPAQLQLVPAPEPVAAPPSDWKFTVHARQRLADRGVSPADAIAAAEHPDTVMPGNMPHTFLHFRGPIKVAVDTSRRTIMTVADRRVTTDIPFSDNPLEHTVG